MGKRKQSRQEKPQIVDHVSDDSEDEEIEEDEAFNSDDERKYGSFFGNDGPSAPKEGDSSGDDSSGDEDEMSEGGDDEGGSDEEDGDGGQYMLDLLDKLDEKKQDGYKDNSANIVASHVKESEFSSSVVPKAGLTLDSLMRGLEDTKGFSATQRTMKKVAQGSATPAPLARVVSNRAKRKVHYEDQAKQVSQWLEAVQENRQAETLDFRPKERMEVTSDVLVDKVRHNALLKPVVVAIKLNFSFSLL
jgi:U3 small nucleolar RNA-associated protein 14